MMTHRVKTGLIAASLIAGLSVAAMSAAAFGSGGHGGYGGHGGPWMNFEQLDANSDGKLSREEMQAAGAARFATSDTNGDGKITKEEAVAHASKRAGERFDRMLARVDADKDGALTSEEMKAGKHTGRMDKMFERVDADSDGFITEEEMKAMRGNHRGMWKK